MNYHTTIKNSGHNFQQSNVSLILSTVLFCLLSYFICCRFSSIIFFFQSEMEDSFFQHTKNRSLCLWHRQQERNETQEVVISDEGIYGRWMRKDVERAQLSEGSSYKMLYSEAKEIEWEGEEKLRERENSSTWIKEFTWSMKREKVSIPFSVIIILSLSTCKCIPSSLLCIRFLLHLLFPFYLKGSTDSALPFEYICTRQSVIQVIHCRCPCF